ncbi:hypothetical protein J4408_01045 [Candidatus Pacearchaeota archaeon]|nr:hypothetical protein [Candidatus Pacearchaeota archaeon]
MSIDAKVSDVTVNGNPQKDLVIEKFLARYIPKGVKQHKCNDDHVRGVTHEEYLQQLAIDNDAECELKRQEREEGLRFT